VIAQIAARVPDARFVGMGGPLMRAAGLESLYDANEIAVMGIVEVLPRVRRILAVLDGLAAWAVEQRPVAAVLIDIPDFNLRLAQRLQERGIPVAYYVAPMAWAWREGRVRTLRQRVDRLLCIYPFEEAWFRRRAVPATFVGNPVLEDPAIAGAPDRASARAALGLGDEERVVALLPGSRRGEVEKLLPTLLEAADRLAAARPGLRFVLPVASSLDRGYIEGHLAGHAVRPLLCDAAGQALRAADVAAVCSGTATLEAALLGTPQVVVYRTSPANWAIVQLFVDVEHASIVNILAEREVVPELLQDDFTTAAVVEELGGLLDDAAARAAMTEAFATLRAELGGGGASVRAAEEVLALAAPRLLRTSAGV
jgi:lipid-A-disaccharide synthase